MAEYIIEILYSSVLKTCLQKKIQKWKVFLPVKEDYSSTVGSCELKISQQNESIYSLSLLSFSFPFFNCKAIYFSIETG